ncbi:hypothetical protein Enr13x_72860 [Stieleria neptunia]|uniref:Secreted protein n=1 Tax=Stieleria neptunia TaxID=2527979 RepID=A0A518I2Y1_9BACT|nr:hypothetical protein [Stieleria neptunia]QDV47377.1 hypothetical protein Enr13x_72860 [Stieleria neptunia]
MIGSQFPIATWPHLVAAVLVSLSAAGSAPAQAQTPPTTEPPHRVRLAPPVETKSQSSGRSSPEHWYPRPLTTLRGTIETYDAEQLAIVLDGQSVPTRVSSRRVIAVELTEVPPDQAAALESFHQGDFSAALPALVRSISDHDASSRPAVWRQQWLSMVAAQAAMRGGQGDIALELVSQLDARPLPMMTLAILPIDWTGAIGGDESMVQMAAGRAASDSLAVKLVVASWLLRSPKYHSAAEAALKRLAEQRDRKTIALLAKQLTFRTQPPPAIEANLRRMENEIEALPMALQTAPIISLLNLVRQAGLTDQAKQWKLTLELAAPNWHPDLAAGVAGP